MSPPGASFGACVRSGVFAWHVAWLSVMQLRHYLFIGTLNPLLERLARGDADLGRARRGHATGDAPWRGPAPALTPRPPQ